MKKRFIMIFAVMAMLLCLPIIANAETGSKYGDYLYYEVNSDNTGITITDCDEAATEIVIPNIIDELPVTSICDSAFEKCNSLKNIVIPDSVTSIGRSAFSGCSGLEDMTIGKNFAEDGNFPILIKLIDAKENLSIQVHPDGNYALQHKGTNAKTEMWYILDCDDGASIYYGFKRDITKQQYETAIKNNTITDILNKVFVHKGDVFFIPAGTVHAIGMGILICEVQQNSNTTFRVYDYDRRDKSGNTRSLHIKEALEASNLQATQYTNSVSNEDDVILSQCEYFTVRRIRIHDYAKFNINKESFHSLIVTVGCGAIEMNGEKLLFNKGDSIFIPAQNSEYAVFGKCEIILSHI